MLRRASPLPLSIAALLGGCFDDNQLRPLSDDLGGVDVPSKPPDRSDGGFDVVTMPDTGIDAIVSDSPDVTDAGDVTADLVDAPPTGCTLDRVLVTTSNFMNGGYALGRFSPTPSLVASDAAAPDQDHLPVQSGCVVYDLLRGDDVLAVLDPMSPTSVVRRIPLRMGGDAGGRYQINPYDVYTHAANKAFVVQYAVPRIAVVDPSRDGADALRSSIDLTPLRSPMDMDASGSPEPAVIVRGGRYLFVALQNLNAFVPVANGTLAVIDPATDALVDANPATPSVDPVRLSGRNPVAMQFTRGGRLVVAQAGVLAFMTPQVLDGGIEVVDPVSFVASGLLVTEAQLGGDIGSMVMFDDARGWVVVTQLMDDAGMSSARVVEFNLDAAEGMRLGRTIVSTGSIAALARDPSGNVWLLDTTVGRAGARVFNGAGMEITTAPLSAGMYPPSGIAFIP